MQQLRVRHFNATRRVLRYLKANPALGILLWADTPLHVLAYCDSDWGACPLARQSLTGYFVTLGASPVSWKTKKKTTISRSSIEEEYRSMVVLTSDLIWLKSLLASLDVHHAKKMKLFCDSQATMHIVKILSFTNVLKISKSIAILFIKDLSVVK